MRTALVIIVLAVVLALGLYLTQRPSTEQPLRSPLSKPSAPGRNDPAGQSIPNPTATAPERTPQAPPEPEPRVVEDDLLRSDSAFQGLFFAAERGLINLAGELQKAQQRMANGEPQGYFDLARVIGNCTLAEEAAEITGSDLQAVTPEDPFAQELARVTNECAPVLAAVPEGQTASDWQLANLRSAAEQGDPLAALELTIDHDFEYSSYGDVLALAQAAAQTEDYRGYFLVADFLTEFHETDGAPINEPRAMQWSLLGCRRSPLCEPEIFEAQLALDYTPAEVEAFRTFAIEQERSIERGETLEVEAGWLPLNSDG
ncbi:MAG: hypothetical protein AAGG11_07840 [Pseudomonadota bacterium]